MAEPVSITLSALALLDPAIKSVRKAYGAYKLTAAFGQHYIGIQRRLDGEQARLETALDTALVSAPSEEQLTQISAQLGHLETHFQACQDLIASIDRRHSSAQNSDVHPQSTASLPTTPSRPGILNTLFSRKKGRRSLQWRKHDQSSTGNSSSGISTPEIQPTASLPTLYKSGTLQTTAQDVDTAQQLQSTATIRLKAEWIGQRKELEEHIKEIHASNGIIRDIVTLRALQSVQGALIGTESQEKTPIEVLAVQDSLHRLHHALKRSNQGPPGQGAALVSIRIMKAVAYVQLRNRLAIQHEYMQLRGASALYPLQIQLTTASSSTVVLAETMTTAQETSTGLPELNTIEPLSGLLVSQSTNADEAFKGIGSITHGQDSRDVSKLFQDVSTDWIIQDTLADLIKSETKFRTYIQLALQVSLSYMYLASIGTTHRYPRLADYRFYKALLDTKRKLGPHDVLEPYLSAGFGSSNPRRSTRDIGGTTSSGQTGDDIMVVLGVLLHEVGCWKMLSDEEDAVSARHTARTQREDLQISAGTPYAQIVETCLTKEIEWGNNARASTIYKKVVVPLEKLVAELGWT
ncbi:MAG: hypothetical protein Q9208_002717 [Pyrenodesmia sp. 3 TL-2023]